MQGILFSTAARGSHVFRPTQTPSTVTTTDDAGSTTHSLVTSTTTAVSTAISAAISQYTNEERATMGPSAGAAPGPSATAGPSTVAAIAQHTAASIVQNAVAQSTMTPMDVDNDSLTLLSRPISNSGKRPFSAISTSAADEHSPSLSDLPSITPAAPAEVSNPVPRKLQKGSHISDPYPLSSCASQTSYHGRQPLKTGKITQATAMVGMQSQIVRLTDVFEKSMTTPRDTTVSKLSLALQKLQDVDDGLSMADKTKLVRLFQRDPSSAQVYSELVVDDLRQAWIADVLKSST